MALSFRDAQVAKNGSHSSGCQDENRRAFESIDDQLREQMSAQLTIGQGSSVNSWDVSATYRALGWRVSVYDDLADRSSTIVVDAPAAFNSTDYAE